MLNRKDIADQFVLELDRDAELERLVEARVKRRAEEEAMRWRFRLIVLETVLMAGLVLVGGLALGLPTGHVLSASLIVGAGCFASGILVIALAGAAGRFASRWRQRRRAR